MGSHRDTRMGTRTQEGRRASDDRGRDEPFPAADPRPGSGPGHGGAAPGGVGPAPGDLRPPFTRETALAKVQAAEDAWNARDPERVALAYSEDSDWRNRDLFLRGRDAIVAFLRDKWQQERDYRLMKELWAWTDDRISVRFEYEWHDASGQWYRTHGNEHWEFDARGLMRRRDMSANDIAIARGDRRISPRARPL